MYNAGQIVFIDMVLGEATCILFYIIHAAI